MAKKHKSANASATIYEGEFNLYFDCVGASLCTQARFYMYPSEPDEDCVSHRDGTCMSGYARKAALKQLLAKIAEEMEQYDPAA